MSARETVLRYMAVGGGTLDDFIDGIVESISSQLKSYEGGELHPDRVEAITVLKRALEARRGEIESACADIYLKHLTEEEIEALIAIEESPAAKKLRSVVGELQKEILTVVADWQRQSMMDVEGDWRRLLGDPAAQAQELPQQATELPTT